MTTSTGKPVTYQVCNPIDYKDIEIDKRYLVEANKEVYKIYKEAMIALDEQLTDKHVSPKNHS